MFFQNYSRAILIAALFFFISIHSNLYSQVNQNGTPSKINITMIGTGGGFSDLEMSVINTFKKVLEENGLFSENDNNIEFLLKVGKSNDDNKIILSVVEMQLLPKEAVEIGKKAEIFYSLLDDSKKANLPAEGKFIREYVSAEYMKQFRMVWDDNLELIDINKLESYCKKIAAKYL
jgi:hypothetical protein